MFIIAIVTVIAVCIYVIHKSGLHDIFFLFDGWLLIIQLLEKTNIIWKKISKFFFRKHIVVDPEKKDFKEENYTIEELQNRVWSSSDLSDLYRSIWFLYVNTGLFTSKQASKHVEQLYSFWCLSEKLKPYWWDFRNIEQQINDMGKISKKTRDLNWLRDFNFFKLKVADQEIFIKWRLNKLNISKKSFFKDSLLEFYRHNYIKSHIDIDDLYGKGQYSLGLKLYKKFTKGNPSKYTQDLEDLIVNKPSKFGNFNLYKANLLTLLTIKKMEYISFYSKSEKIVDRKKFIKNLTKDFIIFNSFMKYSVNDIEKLPVMTPDKSFKFNKLEINEIESTFNDLNNSFACRFFFLNKYKTFVEYDFDKLIEQKRRIIANNEEILTIFILFKKWMVTRRRWFEISKDEILIDKFNMDKNTTKQNFENNKERMRQEELKSENKG
jgi:hypothetical protein